MSPEHSDSVREANGIAESKDLYLVNAAAVAAAGSENKVTLIANDYRSSTHD